MTENRKAVIEKIVELFANRGDSMYAGEPVTQTEHALQTAQLAEQSDANNATITAALLHDIGHLLHKHDEDCAKDGIDDQHEELASRWLTQFFNDNVCQPVRLHVMAKRYRCAVDSAYHDRLSSASVRSLALQGGPLSERQLEEFRKHAFFHQALQLRQWDETAKVPGLPTSTLEHFLSYVETALK